MKNLFILFALFVATISLSAQAPGGGGFTQADIPITVSTYKDAKLLDLAQYINDHRATAEVEVIKGVVYVDRDGVELHMNILYPKGTTKPLPAIVNIPGSAWMKQNLERNIPDMMRFAARGYVIAMVEYRHTGIAPFPAQVQDAKTAIRFIRKNASTYHVDSNNVFIWGDSSGGHTALFVGFTQESSAVEDTDTYNDFSDKVNGVIDFFGPALLSTMSDPPSPTNHNISTSPEGRLIGGIDLREAPEKTRAASPYYYVTKSAAPTLVAHGNLDPVVIMNQSEAIVQELKKQGVKHEYYVLNGAKHGTGEFWTDQMGDIVDKFLKANITR